ncbi:MULTISPECIES: thioesterase II family protein [Pseudonocardia]|uniref:Linear gramicidin dehydrogenase LgrE n=2 Tax=Pseudonocardia TaxID=1847 RepID=A0A1Y2N6T1_PSEAH|nr:MULTISPECIES: alpha/beta fold hydrolase [Pseudonocardia]OSY42807.1 Linear gramicidin dehydrogenase LgrE [Pseudonocardia autotrophica]TDN77384.1 surfactin synthase thioesterase subunit [Pseudonocardia autotrophica]BBG01407.1 thioesterase [Pseudonocardia autotrophica]GEC24463.1 thioesterase [Pseudonocardia saturnea]
MTASVVSTPPIRVTGGAAPDRPALVCLHHAGGSAAAFRDWDAALPGVEVHAVELPGHGVRAAEPAEQDLHRLLDRLDTELGPLLDSRPHVLFGHSMGGLLGYHLSSRRVLRGDRPASALLVAAYSAPHLARPAITGIDLDSVDDLALARHLAGIGGIPAALLRRPEWLPALLGPARADLRVCAGHRYRPGPPLPVPVHAFAGRTDPLVPVSAMAGWAAHTDAGFELTVLPGGHFLVQDEQAGLLPAVATALTGAATAAGTPV